MDLYTNIKKRRIALDISQSELARRTGYDDRSSISKIEKGEFDIPVSKVFVFANALNTTPMILLGFEDDAAPEPLADTLALLRQLDDVDQQKAAAYIEGLLSADKYQKRKEKSIG